MGRRRQTIVNGDEPNRKGVRVGGSNKEPRRGSLAATGAARERVRNGAQSDYKVMGPLFKVADVPQVAEASPEARAARADLMAWISEHPGAWSRMEAEAASIVDKARPRGFKVRIPVSYLVDFERMRGVKTSAGDMFAINNNLKAAMGRYLVELHPEWREYIELRRSKADGAFEVEGK